MPKKAAPKRVQKLKEAFEELCRANQWPPDLASDPSYPTNLIVAPPDGPEDDYYYREVIRRAFAPRAEEPSEENDEAGEDETLVRPRDRSDSLAEGVVVYRIRGRSPESEHGRQSFLPRTSRTYICQIVQSQTRQAPSVLGRVGVVDLIGQQLQERLIGRGSLDDEGNNWSLTRADLARIITEGADVDAMDKFLKRLNRGEFVSEGNALKVANAFHLSLQDLVFSNQAVYQHPGEQEQQTDNENQVSSADPDIRRRIKN
jgi:hypothetical protein